MEQQGLTETKMRYRIADETKHLNAIENWLAQQPGNVTEADARAWFDAHKSELNIPERVRASHIFLTRLADKDTTQDREPEIRKLHGKLVAKEATLEELARQFSDDDGSKPRGGDLGWFSRNRVPPEFAEKVFALPVGEISAPFESHLGWHILLVREKQPARAPEFAEVQNEITAILESQWREATLKRLVSELRAKAKIEKFESRVADVHP
ncbi:MAG: peptidylprolyl isomerase [Verrucomicrobiaceae bacterium]